MSTESERKKLLARLSRIEGQVGGVKRMVNEDKYCMDVLQQISAIQGALAQVSKQLLQGHLRTCVPAAFRSNDAELQEQMVAELVDLYARTRRGGPSK